MAKGRTDEIRVEWNEGETRIVIEDKDAALGLAAVLSTAAGPRTVNGMKTLDVGWLELFEDLNEAIKGSWPDCTCDLLCRVHGKPA